MIATAIHDGHAVRPEIARLFALDEATRLREEDPHTGRLAAVAPAHLIVLRSRFEVDLNRPRDEAVYREAADSWGLEVWREACSDDARGRLAGGLRLVLRPPRAVAALARARFVVLDCHSYNHRAAGSRCAAGERGREPGDQRRHRHAGPRQRGAAWSTGSAPISPPPRCVGTASTCARTCGSRAARCRAWINRTFADRGCAHRRGVQEDIHGRVDGTAGHRSPGPALPRARLDPARTASVSGRMNDLLAAVSTPAGGRSAGAAHPPRGWPAPHRSPAAVSVRLPDGARAARAGRGRAGAHPGVVPGGVAATRLCTPTWRGWPGPRSSALADACGACLLLELWIGPEPGQDAPRIRLLTPSDDGAPTTIEALADRAARHEDAGRLPRGRGDVRRGPVSAQHGATGRRGSGPPQPDACASVSRCRRSFAPRDGVYPQVLRVA